MLFIDDDVVKLVSNDCCMYGMFTWWGRNWGF